MEDSTHCVWVDERINVIYTKVFAVKNSIADFERDCENYNSLIKELIRTNPNLKYSIFDGSEVPALSTEYMSVYFGRYVPLQLNNGVKYKAFVAPGHLFGKIMIDEAPLFLKGCNVQFFDTINQALFSVLSLHLSDN